MPSAAGGGGEDRHPEADGGAALRRPAVVDSPAVAESIDRGQRIPLWVRGILPLVLLAMLVAFFLRYGPIGVFQSAFPPLEELTIDRVTFPGDGLLRVHVVNGGPEAVNISQVTMDEAYWAFQVDPGPTVPRLGNATIDVPYPWVEGEPVVVGLVTSTGVTFTHEVPVATRSPDVGARYLSTFTLLGVYVGVIPVFLGLLWLPFLAEVSERWLHFFLSFTVGLLVFLGIDALAESVEMAAVIAPAFQGTGLVALGLLSTPLLIEAFSRLSRSRTSDAYRAASLIALGIGLHNLGEGLAVGSAYAVGEIALGTTLVLGFLLHNTTEGIGIIAPIANDRPSLARLATLGAVAGLPTIVGAWIGGFSYSPSLAVLFLAVGAGAVVQVVWTLGRLLVARSAGLGEPLNAAGLVAGLFLMWATGLLVAV